MHGDVAKATSPCQKQYNDEKISNIDTQKELPYGSSLQVYGVYAVSYTHLDAVRIVEIPRERRSARAAARLEVRHVRARLRIIVLLVLPSHEPVLDIDVPAARTRAVDTVRRVNALVKRPTVAIGVFPFTAAFKELLMSRRRFLDWDEMLPFCNDIAHVITLLLYLILSDFISHSCDKYHGRTLLRKKNLPRRISRLSSMDSAHSMLQISLPQFSHWMASLR